MFSLKRKNLNGAVVVITGAGSGIGRASALAFARKGARLHLLDIDGDSVEDAAQETQAIGAEATAYQLDCTDSEAMQVLADRIFEKEGRVDVLFNNAGVCLGGPTEKFTLKDWKWIVDVNFWGVVNGIHAFLPPMIEQGDGGHIVNTASMAGLVGLPMVAPYCATKFAIVGLSEALSTELTVHGIDVTVLCPGTTRTNVMRNARLDLPGDMTQKMVKGLGRWPRGPERVADLVVDAVEKRKPFITSGLDMLPLWWAHRVSTRLYLQAAQIVTRLVRNPDSLKF